MTAARPAQEIWLVRHGETASNRDHVVQGHTDIPLHQDGERQAKALGRRLRAQGVTADAVISSDLSRALRTAELACAHLDLQVETDAAWREACFGDLEGGPGRALTEFRESAGTQAAGVAPPGGGESLLELQARAAAAFHRVADRGLDRVLVFTHGGTIAGVVAHILGTSLTATFQRAFRRDNTSLTIVRRRRVSSDQDDTAPRHLPHWHLVVLNDTAHLSDH